MIYIGFDSTEPAAYFALRRSILAHNPTFRIEPLCEQSLRLRRLYWREKDPLASTEFTYTRFLVPHLMNYRGWALFMDSDMLCRTDIGELFAMVDERYAVMCVNRAVTPEVVNTETGGYLHQFQWVADDLIGSIPEAWNWLEGWSKGEPKIVHYTRGIPGIHDGFGNAPYSDEFLSYA